MVASPPVKRVLVVGAGLAGAVFARELAENSDIQISVVDRSDHVAGNCHTHRDVQTGVMVHAYGPHIFHTSNAYVWSFVQRFAQMMPFTNRVKAHIDRGVFGLPINLHTINQFFGRSFNPQEAREFCASLAQAPKGEPANFEEQALALIGPELYEAFFYGYTRKQWGCHRS